MSMPSCMRPFRGPNGELTDPAIGHWSAAVTGPAGGTTAIGATRSSAVTIRQCFDGSRRAMRSTYAPAVAGVPASVLPSQDTDLTPALTRALGKRRTTFPACSTVVVNSEVRATRTATRAASAWPSPSGEMAPGVAVAVAAGTPCAHTPAGSRSAVAAAIEVAVSRMTLWQCMQGGSVRLNCDLRVAEPWGGGDITNSYRRGRRSSRSPLEGPRTDRWRLRSYATTCSSSTLR